MKIIFVSKEYPPSPRSYGIGTYVWESANALSRAGHQVTVLAASDDALSRRDRIVEGIRVIRLPDVEKNVPRPLTWELVTSSRSLGTVYSLQAYWKVRRLGIAYRTAVSECLEKLIDEGSAEIVEFAGYRGESLVWAARHRRIPMVVRAHGRTAWVHRSWRSWVVPRERLMNAWETKELIAADRVTVVAPHMIQNVSKRVNVSRIHAIYNGIDTARWLAINEGGEQLTAKDVLFVGSLVKSKGTFLLIEAAEMLRRTMHWDGRLLLVGRCGTEFENYVRRRWKSVSSLPNWIRALGHCERDSLDSMYATAGVCCLPSYNEGLNYTGLEALAAGAILVGSSQGMAELIRGGAGFLFPAGDRNALCSALASALALDQDARQSMRARGRLVAHRDFNIAMIAEQMVESYRAIIQNFREIPALTSRPLLPETAER